ncbi:MAG: methyltransferase [Alphaproteobacteria bacterium]|nr:methyltransferase [Alphaproteobacteria bacterium]
MERHPLDGRPYEAIEAQIGYLVDTDEKPTFFHSYEPGVPTQHTGTRELRAMPVRNGRTMEESFTLALNGFCIVPHHSAVTDFYDDAQLSGVYDHEVEALVREKMGATRVVVFDHTRRSSDQSLRAANNSREPASVAHTDYTDWSAAKRLGEIVPDADPARRYAIVNVWRPITLDPCESWPLALCDGRAVDTSYMRAVQRRTIDRVGESRHSTFDVRHRWIYFPRMTRDEAIILKNYDTIDDGRTAKQALHVSFDDPTSPPDAKPRESIETRTFVFFD